MGGIINKYFGEVNDPIYWAIWTEQGREVTDGVHVPHIPLLLPAGAAAAVLRSCPRRWLAVRNVLLLAAGYVFYAWVEPVVRRSALRPDRGQLRPVPSSSRGPDVEEDSAAADGLCRGARSGVLGFFKYTVFFEENLNSLCRLSAVSALPVLKIVLPVGISFYTFKIISYIVDVYRGQSPPARSLLDFACYVSFFPQLLSGPIQRYGTIDRKSEPVPTFADQLVAREHTLDKFSWGVALFMLGFAKKILLANAVAQVADAVFAAAVARDARCVVRRPGVLVPVVLRFLRLLGDGHRHRADAGFRVPAQLRRSVPGRQLQRFLATLAHLAVELAAGLSLHPARRQPGRGRPDVCQPDDRVPPVRLVARSRLDVHRLGRLAWSLAGRRASPRQRGPSMRPCPPRRKSSRRSFWSRSAGSSSGPRPWRRLGGCWP